MSYSQHRPSILHRPQRAQPSRATEETFESQYEREQALLRAKQEKQQETQSRLLRSLHPQQEDKAAAWEALVSSNTLLASRPGRAEQREQAPPTPSNSGGPLPEGVRPWHHATATQQYSAEEEDAARRRFAAEVAAENQRLARERELVRQAEQQARREPVDSTTWYSRGDTHHYAQPLYSGDGIPAPGTAYPATGPVAYTAAQVPAWQQQQQPQNTAAQAPVWQQQRNTAAQAPVWQQQQPQQQPHQQRPPSASPWATEGDGQVLVRPQTAQQQPSKLPERVYPWSWAPQQ